MFIQSIKVKNFGPLRELDIGLRPCGINLISGANATGKTQLLGALIASLVGRKALSLSKSAEDESSIEVILSEPPDFERIELKTSTRPNGQVYIQHHVSAPNGNQCNGQLSQRLSEALTPGRNPSLIMDGTMPSNHFTRAVLYAIERTDVFRSLPLYMQEELKRLAEHDYPIGSWNLQVFTSLLSEYASRRWHSNKIPLLVDDPFAALDYVSIEPLWQILLAIAEDQQVIVLTSITNLPVDPIVVLGTSSSLPNSKATYNYRSHRRSLASKKYAQPKFIYGNSFQYD